LVSSNSSYNFLFFTAFCTFTKNAYFEDLSVSGDN